MTEMRNWPVDNFQEHRSRLRGVAYRMLGSVTEADDAVPDAWLRVRIVAMDVVYDPSPWPTSTWPF